MTDRPERLAWFSFYPEDFLSSQRVGTMSTEEIGAYILLLCSAWSDPDCSIPDDDEELANLTRLSPERWERAARRLRRVFLSHPEQPGRLHNPRLTEERNKAIAISEGKRRRAASYWDRRKENASALHLHPTCTPDAPAPALHTESTCTAPAPHLHSTCNAPAPYIPHTTLNTKEYTPAPAGEAPAKEKKRPAVELLKDAWQAAGLHRSDRAGQGYSGKGMANRCEALAHKHGIEALTAAIAAYARTFAFKSDGVAFAQAFSTFFGTGKSTFLEFLPQTGNEGAADGEAAPDTSEGEESPLRPSGDEIGPVARLVSALTSDFAREYAINLKLSALKNRYGAPAVMDAADALYREEIASADHDTLIRLADDPQAVASMLESIIEREKSTRPAANNDAA